VSFVFDGGFTITFLGTLRKLPVFGYGVYPYRG